MLPKERVIAALEHRRPDRVPAGEIGVDYPITERALGRSTLYRAKWKEYQAWWQGRRAEIVESMKRDIVDLARFFEWDFVPAPLVPPASASPDPPEFIDMHRWRLVDGSEWAFSPESEGHAICTKYPPMTIADIPAPTPLDESRLEVVEYIVKELGGTHFILGRPDEDGTFPYEDTVGLEEFLARMVADPEFVRRAIEAGIDGWHGVQPSIGMDLGLLRETYGDRLCLFGGVDCTTLVAGAPEDAAREAHYAIRCAGLDGGLVLASSNTLMVGVRYENYLAMLAAAREASGLDHAAL